MKKKALISLLIVSGVLLGGCGQVKSEPDRSLSEVVANTYVREDSPTTESVTSEITPPVETTVMSETVMTEISSEAPVESVDNYDWYVEPSERDELIDLSLFDIDGMIIEKYDLKIYGKFEYDRDEHGYSKSITFTKEKVKDVFDYLYTCHVYVHNDSLTYVNEDGVIMRYPSPLHPYICIIAHYMNMQADDGIIRHNDICDLLPGHNADDTLWLVLPKEEFITLMQKLEDLKKIAEKYQE